MKNQSSLLRRASALGSLWMPSQPQFFFREQSHVRGGEFYKVAINQRQRRKRERQTGRRS